MTYHFPDQIINALKETLVLVFWTKKHLRETLGRCEVPSEAIASQDWTNYKYHIIDPILSGLNASEDGLRPLRLLLAETLDYKDCTHLLRFPEGQKRKRDGERQLEHLRLLVKNHDSSLRAKQEEQLQRKKEREKVERQQTFQSHLLEFRDLFVKWTTRTDPAKRGYDLEDLLNGIFDLFELSPRGPFKLLGEQIDGAFILDGDDFLMEAKWQKEPVSLGDLRDLDGAVESKLDNTLGLFVAINGFSDEALQAYPKGTRPRLLCMDGADLFSVLEGRIDLADLLQRKRTIAAQRGLVFVPFHDILAGKY
ncbi:MAG: restriction endonuclease [Caldilineaceae bacterium SB0670_bin_27]|nr:restriction endonuclease [Caldilineaceae bacterium SB0670_bin_27]